MAQLVRAPPCHGGGRRFESDLGRKAGAKHSLRGLSSAGRASALQAEGHRFEPYRPHNIFKIFCVGWCGGIGRRKGLKIPRWQHRAGSSPATSIVMNRNPQFQPGAEVDSFSLSKIIRGTGSRRAGSARRAVCEDRKRHR